LSASEQLSFEAAEELAAAGGEAEAEPQARDDGGAEPVASLPPTAEQARAIAARDRDVFMEAGAGTGKTRVLVGRYCEAVDADGVEPERILAFTFTEKAAAEMRRRVRSELARRAEAAEGERRERLQQAARAGEAAPITTIHGFCRRLLGSHPVAAGLDPRFRVLDAEESARLAAVAFDRALDELAAGSAEVARLAAGYRGRLRGLITAAYADLRNHGRSAAELPPLQINAFDGSEEPADPLEVEIATATYDGLRALLARFGERFAEVKAERSGVDFDDLQVGAVELLRGSPAVAAAERERFDHLLVDEFQDTSPIQVELIELLRGPETRLFTVGDEFQSIYAFRGADLASFRRERERVRERSGEDALLRLGGSFRSTADVVAAVNAVGASLLDGFVPLTVGRPDPPPPAGPDGPAVELLLTERGEWEEQRERLPTAAAETPVNRVAEARFLARRLRELADEGVAPASMVVLLRAFTHVDAYAEALELAGLDPYVVGGRGYWSAQQVEDALRLLSCVANPLDDEALFGALASPACGAGPDALWILRRIAGRRRHVWPALARHVLGGGDGGKETEGGESENGDEGKSRNEKEDRAGAKDGDGQTGGDEGEQEAEARRWAEALPAGDRERIEEFGRELVALRARAAQLPLDALVEEALSRFGYDLVALSLPGGRRRAANLRKLVRIAGEYEQQEGRDLRGFLAYAAERAAFSDRESEGTTSTEGHDGVRVMTVHAAKGLEFDCVVVADLGRGLAGGRPAELRLAFDGSREDPDEPSPPRVGLRLARAGARSLDVEGYRALTDQAAAAEAEESARLAYVAASRARERLILSGLFDPEDVEGGRDELKPRHSVLARLLPVLGAGGEDGEVLTVPAAAAREDIEATFADAPIAVRVNAADEGGPGRLRLEPGGPAAARPAEAPSTSPPLLALGERPGSAARSLSYAALSAYERCGYRFLIESVLGHGRAAPPGSPAAEESPAREDDELELDPGPGPADAPRIGRLGLGRVVHELLEWSARNGWRSPGTERALPPLRREGAERGAPQAAEAVLALVEGWLDSELLAELRDRGASFRPEVPFRIALGGWRRGTVLRGTIDLLAELPGEPPLVLDYKSGARPAGAELPGGYEIQRRLYALAIAEATGAKRIDTAYVFLADPSSPVRRLLDEAAIAAGRERIEELVAGIRERRLAVTDSPGAALCHDCPARERLCPHPPELTLAR
jgi:ATP-dependent helicase/nuclease subunit A